MTENHKEKTNDIVFCLHKTFPVMVGYIPLGIIYGFFAVQSGLSVVATIMTTVLINGGAAQFVMVPMIVAQAPLHVIALAALVINLRFVFYGVPLLHVYAKQGLKGLYCIFGLTDETFSLVLAGGQSLGINRIFLITLMNHIWITLGTIIGAVLGARVQTDLVGMDFVLCSLFVMLATELWRFKKTGTPIVIALVAYVIALFVSASNALAVALLIIVGAGFAWSKLLHAELNHE